MLNYSWLAHRALTSTDSPSLLSKFKFEPSMKVKMTLRIPNFVISFPLDTVFSFWGIYSLRLHSEKSRRDYLTYYQVALQKLPRVLFK